MGQCDEFASYMTQDVAQWWLLYSLSLQSLLHHVKQLRPCFLLLLLLLSLKTSSASCTDSQRNRFSSLRRRSRFESASNVILKGKLRT